MIKPGPSHVESMIKSPDLTGFSAGRKKEALWLFIQTSMRESASDSYRVGGERSKLPLPTMRFGNDTNWRDNLDHIPPFSF